MKRFALTQKEAEEEVRLYQDVFDVVRILKKSEIGGLCPSGDPQRLHCPCYSFWGKKKVCDNCTSARALTLKKDQGKIEFSKTGVYYVISRYLEIDGEPCVMELLREFDQGNIIDLTGEEKLLSRIDEYYEKTYTDVLTGVYNRRFYEEEIKNSTLRAGVAMLDLDDFKTYNDRYGHAAGDEVLARFAKELKNDIRSSDKLIRYGGDEFLLIMPGVQSNAFESTLRHILERVSALAFPKYCDIRLTVSIGATLCAGETIQEASERADRLLYKAKNEKNALASDGGVSSKTK